jgi:hypothetical protein
VIGCSLVDQGARNSSDLRLTTSKTKRKRRDISLAWIVGMDFYYAASGNDSRPFHRHKDTRFVLVVTHDSR